MRLEKGEFVVVLEKQKKARMVKGHPYAIIKEMIGTLTDRAFIGEDAVMYCDDCASIESYGKEHLGINRKVEGVGVLYGNIVICNIEVDGWDKNLCGFTEEGANAAIKWAQQYTDMLFEVTNKTCPSCEKVVVYEAGAHMANSPNVYNYNGTHQYLCDECRDTVIPF
jgi:hypothetical protein